MNDDLSASQGRCFAIEFITHNCHKNVNLGCASCYQSYPYIYAINDTNMVIMRMRVMGAILVVVMQDSEILCQCHVGEYKVFVKVLLIIL
jgi:hypothetical protein